MRFSTRVPADLAPNRLTVAELALRRRGVRLIDLTETNPTRVGLGYPGDCLDALASPASLAYDPQPFGLMAARQAVADELRRTGLHVDPARLILTASTSEAYTFLFKLLCDPGDQVLVPVPSYPLFEHLTRLELVEVRPYPLEYHGTWSIDFEGLDRALTPRTKGRARRQPEQPDRIGADAARAGRPGRAVRLVGPGAHRRRGVRGVPAGPARRPCPGARPGPGAHVQPRRPVEIGRPPADEARLDGGGRPARARRGRARAAGDRL